MQAGPPAVPLSAPNPSSRKSRRPKQQAIRERSIWSAPSFSAGVIFGAGLVLLLGYAPTVFEDTVAATRGHGHLIPENITFEFEEILENGTVEVDPNAYEAQFPGENPDEPLPEYQVQAISVKSATDATRITRERSSPWVCRRDRSGSICPPVPGIG